MAERKKIALCLEYPLALRGGVSVLVETLLQSFARHHDLILVSPDRPDDLAKHPAGSLIADHIPWQPGEVSPQTSRALAQEIKRRGAALAHFHLGGNFGWGNRFPGHCPFPFLKQLGIPVFTTVHSVVSPLDGFCGPQKPLWFKLAMFPLATFGKWQSLASVRHEIAVSKHDETKLRRWNWPLRRKYLQLYHSRLRAGSRPQSPPPREQFLLNVGHLSWRKGQPLLAEAFAQIAPRHPEWKLLLVGGLMEQEIVEKIHTLAKAHRLEDRILLLGERSDTPDLMSHAGVYIQPSFHEALGLALQEAMFYGCPSIGTRAGGIPELIDHKATGLLVPPGDASQMARAIETLIANPALREKYGHAAAAAIVDKGMTADQMIARHLELYAAAFRQA